jgi:hypothetical protein
MYICARLHNQVRIILERLILFFILKKLDSFSNGDIYIRYIRIFSVLIKEIALTPLIII